MNYAIVTGASKGLGASAALRFISEGIPVITVSRNENTTLKQAAESAGISYTHYSCDLSSAQQVQSVFAQICDEVFVDAENVYVINNAGVIEPIDVAGELDAALVQSNIQVNLTAPILISNLLLQKAKNTDSSVVIANVTSGAGERPIQGWSIYCSTKAAVNMFTMTAGLELENSGSSSKVIAFSPGLMDTDMQVTIRSSSEEAFADVDTFRNYKESGNLRSPDTVAGALVKLVLAENLENGKVYKVNDLL
ncbi:(S)-benzoin forming benzil reductase [Mesobacillus jeotgali]|uniref:(S)-benzoin forming benzil reductase n=1 Tax=Mesobacillus jeotgali TaxID=129985 RepID=UPI001CFE36F7|nr:(S)-benzoin forming benzil reductase [Mesobacillus jeotgali]